jgi:hypothetical protein
MTEKNILKISLRGIKNAEFYADSKVFEMGSK